MRLKAYLEAREESRNAFARRAGISQQIVSNICGGSGCHSTTAKQIVDTTGGLVSLDDLQPLNKEAGEDGAGGASARGDGN